LIGVRALGGAKKGNGNSKAVSTAKRTTRLVRKDILVHGNRRKGQNYAPLERTKENHEKKKKKRKKKKKKKKK
jgi:hypothetical protein